MLKKWLGLFFLVTLLEGCDYSYREWEGRGSTFVTFVDDSLALFSSWREYERCVQNPVSDVIGVSPDCDGGGGGGDHVGLFLVNYREKQPVLWGDTLDYYFSILKGYYKDSSVIFTDSKGWFGFWKIGEEPRKVRKLTWDENCGSFVSLQARPWLNNQILFSGIMNCGYAVLDTATGIVRKLDFTGDNAWLKGCDDISVFNEKVVCLKPIFLPKIYGVYYVNNGIIQDSLVWDESYWAIEKKVLTFHGPIFSMTHPALVSLFEGAQLFKIKGNEKMEALEPSVWLDWNKFIYSDSTIVEYTLSDLIVTQKEK